MPSYHYPAWSSLETNTFTEPVPYLCDIAWARKARYDVKNIADPYDQDM